MSGPKGVTGENPASTGMRIYNPIDKSSTCCGRKVTDRSFLCQKILFSITTVVGSILLVLGGLALASYFLTPLASGSVALVLEKITMGAMYVANLIATDLLTLAIFTTAFGTAFTVVGSIGLAINDCHPPQPKPEILQDELQMIDDKN